MLKMTMFYVQKIVRCLSQMSLDMDSNLHSSKDNKAHDGPSRLEHHDNTTQNQSTPQTDDIAFRSRHLSQTSLNMNSNLNSSKNNKVDDGPSGLENHDNTTQNQSTPQTDDIAFRSRHLSQTSLNMIRNLYSSKNNKVDDGPSRYENHDNHTHKVRAPKQMI